jgi:hypothetical protein
MEKDRKKKKIDYVRPQILDLGPVTPAVGGTCQPNGVNPTGKPDGCGATGDWVAICLFGQNGSDTL